MPRRRTIAAAAVALLAIASTSDATTTIDRSFADLVHRADVIAVGTVTRVAPRWDAARRAPVTDVTFEGVDAVKGNVRGGRLTLHFLGGPRPDGTVLHVAGAPTFTVGERALVFSAGNGRDAVPLVGVAQGAMRVAADAQGVATVRTAQGHAIGGVRDGRLVQATRDDAALPLSTMLDLVRDELRRPHATE